MYIYLFKSDHYVSNSYEKKDIIHDFYFKKK